MKPFKYQLEFTAISIAAVPAAAALIIIGDWEMAGACAAMVIADFLICALLQYQRHRRGKKARDLV